MKFTRSIAVLACLGLFGAAIAQDPLLGKGKGSGRGSGSSSSGGSKGSSGSGREGGSSKGSSGSGRESGGSRGSGSSQSGGSNSGSRSGGGSVSQGGGTSGGGIWDRGGRPPRIGGTRDDNQGRRTDPNVTPRNSDRILIAPGVPFEKKGSSRSGRGSYDGTNNLGAQRRFDNAPRIDRLQRMDWRSGSLHNQVRREDRGVNITFSNNGWRIGYYSYDHRWRDSNFYYPYYCFNPYVQVVPSPWYYYHHLPPYISYRRANFVPGVPTSINISGFAYNWRRPSWDWGYNDDNYGPLDYALEDIERSFRRNDRRAISNLLPNRGPVHIYVDNSYSYSVGPDDFYDMMIDLVEATYTLDYEVLDVRTFNGDATVKARHVYLDPWGRQVTTIHQYVIVEERGDAIIRGFGTYAGYN